MNRTAIATGLLAAFCALGAHATPLRLDYTVTESADLLFGIDFGTHYTYDFTFVLDDNDGSWTAGQEFDWFVIGDDPVTSPFTTSMITFLSVPAGASGTSTSGDHNGPSVNFGPSAFLPGWMPTAIGDSFSFSFVTTNLVAPGDLLWSNIASSSGAVNADFEVANYVSAVPLPASGVMLLAGLGATAAARRKR